MNLKTEKLDLNNERRSSERRPHQGTVTFSIFNQKSCIDGQSLDYSRNGLKFKSNCLLQPGTTICIRVKSGKTGSNAGHFYTSLPSLGLAEVKWCREIRSGDTALYEVGVQYHPPDY